MSTNNNHNDEIVRTAVVVLGRPSATAQVVLALARRGMHVMLLCTPAEQLTAARLRDNVRAAGGDCVLLPDRSAAQAWKRQGRPVVVIDMRPDSAENSVTELPAKLRLLIETMRETPD